jgi:hypothetical protein
MFTRCHENRRGTKSWAGPAVLVLAFLIIMVVAGPASAHISSPEPAFSGAPTVGDSSGSYVKGSMQAVVWNITGTGKNHEFRVYADPASGCDVLLGKVTGSSALHYTFDWSIAQGPSTGWKVYVEAWDTGLCGDRDSTSSRSAVFAILPATYAITVTAGDNGAIDPGTGPVATLSDATYTITPDTGFHIQSLTVDDEAQDAPYPDTWQFKHVAADHSLAATFARNTYEFSASVVGGADGHGAISPSGDQTVPYGDQPTYTFTPEEGYHILVVKVDDQAVEAPDGQYIFAPADGPHSITVEYAVNTFTISATVVGGADGNGSISPLGDQLAAYGDRPVYNFTPDFGYHVAAVRVDGAAVDGSSGRYTFDPITALHDISVEFAANTFAVQTRPGDGGGIQGPGIVTFGQDALYTFAPVRGWVILDVLVDGQSMGPVTQVTLHYVTCGHTVGAVFGPDQGMAPRTVVNGGHVGWSTVYLPLKFTATPGETGAPVDFTEYRLNGGQWQHGSDVTITAEGRTVIEYRSQDKDGRLESPIKQLAVRVDSKDPRMVARHASARRGKIARLSYNVTDPVPSSGFALVRAVVFTRSGAVGTRASSLPQPVNSWHKLQIRTGSLAPGTYRVRLLARDLAGNWQKTPTWTRLTIH